MRPTAASRSRVPRFRGLAVMAAAAILLLVGCARMDSGGGGGGGGGGDYTLYVLLVNRHTEAHTLSYSGGAPLESSPDSETAESCTAIIVHYAVEVPFELLVDGAPVIVSDELPQGVPADGETNMIATMDVLPDGSAVPVVGDSSGGSAVAAGTNLSKPAALGICF